MENRMPPRAESFDERDTRWGEMSEAGDEADFVTPSHLDREPSDESAETENTSTGLEGWDRLEDEEGPESPGNIGSWLDEDDTMSRDKDRDRTPV